MVDSFQALKEDGFYRQVYWVLSQGWQSDSEHLPASYCTDQLQISISLNGHS